MRIKDNIGKILWSIADKGLFVMYGLLVLYQTSIVSPEDIGLFFLLFNLTNWIIVISDAFSLQGLIQFSGAKYDRSEVNYLASVLHYPLTMGISFIIWIFSFELSELFGEAKLADLFVYVPLIVMLSAPRTHALKLILRDMEFHKLFISNLILFGGIGVLTLYSITMSERIDYVSLMYFYIISLAASSVYSVTSKVKALTMRRNRGITLRNYLKFSVPVTFQSGLHSLPKLLDIYLIQFFFTNLAIVGIYSTAKNLYRFFDEGLMAANGLIYPVAVKLLGNNDLKSLNNLITKGVSFTLSVFLVITCVIWLGGAEVAITMFQLGAKYYDSIAYLNIMAIGVLALPFMMMGYIIIASGKQLLLLNYVIISLAIFFIIFIYIGITQQKELIPLGLVSYNISLGFLCFYHVKKTYGFQLKYLFRSLNDTMSYFKTIKKSK